MAAIRQRCHNCKHAGKPFRIVGKTHLHCEHPKYSDDRFESGEISPWDTLMDWCSTCPDWELKEVETKQTN